MACAAFAPGCYFVKSSHGFNRCHARGPSFIPDGGVRPRGTTLNYFIDACANALVEAQRAARYLIFLHVSKAAGDVCANWRRGTALQGSAALLDALGAGRRFCGGVLLRLRQTPSPRPASHRRHERDRRRDSSSHAGPTWGNCARGLSVVHESNESVGKGRRARARPSSGRVSREGRFSSGIITN